MAKYTDAEFRIIYGSSATIDEVVSRTGYKLSYVVGRASALGLKLSTPTSDQYQLSCILEFYCQMSPEWQKKTRAIFASFDATTPTS